MTQSEDCRKMCGEWAEGRGWNRVEGLGREDSRNPPLEGLVLGHSPSHPAYRNLYYFNC